MSDRILLRPALMAFAMTCGVHAQAPMLRIVPIAPGQPAAEAQPQVENAEAAEAKDENFADKLMELDFNRSPEAVTNAIAKLREDEEMPASEVFRHAVLFGDWAAVGKTLASLPVEKARPVYQKIISTLGSNAVPVGTLLREPDRGSDEEEYYEIRNRLMQEANELRTKPAPVLSEDFFGLVEAAPGGVTADNIDALAQLAAVAIGEGGRETLVTRLKQGWKGLGGAEPDGALLATRLLSALGWIRDAGPFLPLEEADWEQADPMQLIHAMEYFTRTGIEDRDERQLARAAAVCATLLKSSRVGNYTRPQFRLAMERLVVLLPALEPEAARKLIREHLFTQQATLEDLIAIFGQQGQKVAKETDLAARASILGTQRRLLEAIAPLETALPANTVILVLNWLAEAEGCYRAGGIVATEMSQSDRMMMRRYGFEDGSNINSLSTEQVLSTAPPAEVIDRLNPGISQRVQLTLLKLRVISTEALDFDAIRAYAKRYPGLERQLCQDILAAWVAKQQKPSESPQVRQMRMYGMYIPPQLLQASQGIPLTRLRQNRNISELRDLLKELRSISPEPLDAALIVEAFMALHSGAEVYQIDDITAIFGPPDQMPRQELLTLLEGMRGRLAEEWRDPKTQQQAATNRTENEIKDEVSRGYRTLLELARRGIAEDDEEWTALITRGRLFFDASQYEFERQVQLSEYVGLRDDAFASFRLAAERYAKQLPEMPKGQWTIEPYQAWFFVMLGASDLAQLTSNPARSDPGLQGIADAIRALPEDAAQRHLGMFAEMLGEVFPKVPANVRQRFLAAGLKIVGEDHPDAAQATRSLDYYKELLDEIQLRVNVDGPTEVGHGEPFGVYISLETTRQLLRESGGFGKYLRNASSGQQQMMMGGQPAQDLRGAFLKNIHASLDETFDVVSVVFHDSGVKPIPLAREGWVETPLAYAVLKAKNAAVDRIPSIQIDMDFIDQPGQVVLPVTSQVQPIDARATDPATRPCPNLEFLVTLDEREWREGTLVVEISATGHGIIGDLDQWFDHPRDGFDAELVDGSLAVTELVSDGEGRSPRANRSWQITYCRNASYAGGRFILPTPTAATKATAEIEYKLYRDADLVELSGEEAARGIDLPGTPAGRMPWIVGGLGVLAAAFLGWRFLAGRGRGPQTTESIVPPAEATPFATVAFLRRLRGTIDESRRADIDAEIAAIESSCFRADADGAVDLSDVVRRWMGACRQP